MLDKDLCGMHEAQTVKDCCKKDKSRKTHTVNYQNETCCTDGYLFAISAKFGAIEIKQIQIPIGNCNQVSMIKFQPNVCLPVSNFLVYRAPPPELAAGVRVSNCVWLI
jgi:hypothetical protein